MGERDLVLVSHWRVGGGNGLALDGVFLSGPLALRLPGILEFPDFPVQGIEAASPRVARLPQEANFALRALMAPPKRRADPCRGGHSCPL